MGDWWRDVPGYEGHYQVSRAGQVYSLKRHRLLAQVEGERGYLTVNLYRNGRPEHCLVHRLVAAAFLGPIPPGYQVNHVDADKSNNRLTNLEIVTPEENRAHAARCGLLRDFKGEANIRAKLTEGKVRDIRRLREEGMRVQEIAWRFQVSERVVRLICRRKLWGHVD